MTARPVERLTCAVLLVVLTGCASPREHLYILDNRSVDPIGTPESRTTVILGPISIPQELDRPQIVVRDGPSQILLNEQQRWAAPLQYSLPRLLAAELDRNQRDYRFIPTSRGAIAMPKARLAIDITRFEVSQAAGASVSAHWIYRASGADSAGVEGDAGAHVNVSKAGYDGFVEALRSATAQLASLIASKLPSNLAAP